MIKVHNPQAAIKLLEPILRMMFRKKIITANIYGEEYAKELAVALLGLIKDVKDDVDIDENKHFKLKLLLENKTLKPCPYCKSTNLRNARVYIKCNNCLMTGPQMNGGKNDDHADIGDENAAISAWNNLPRDNKPKKGEFLPENTESDTKKFIKKLTEFNIKLKKTLKDKGYDV